MTKLRYTLLSDGSSDRCLLPLIRWLLRANKTVEALDGQWADLNLLPRPPQGLRQRIVGSIDLFPCDVLFVHRDAEKQNPQWRYDEIAAACREPGNTKILTPILCVIPVRMTEAWLLFDECAVRAAAGNPNGSMRLTMPSLSKLEELPNPKATLRALLDQASGLKGRRLQKFQAGQAAIRVSEYVKISHLCASCRLFVCWKSRFARSNFQRLPDLSCRAEDIPSHRA